MQKTTKEMTDDEVILQTQFGYDVVFNTCKALSILPIEDWLEAFNRFDSVGPILHPTLYKELIYSKKAKVIRELLQVCLPVKAKIDEIKKLVEANPEEYQ